MADVDAQLAANAARARGSLQEYDSCRPAPPAVFADTVLRFMGASKPELVVDLGCGTGLSTRYWSPHAARVLGVEPNAQMLAVARANSANTPNVTYQAGFSHELTLPDNAADIVTCCQSLHWMDPERTIPQVARVLRPGGVWAVLDYDLPLIHWEIERAIQATIQKAKQKTSELGLGKEQKAWPGQHAERISASGAFRVVRESSLAGTDSGDAARLMGLIRSLGAVALPLQKCSDAELGLDELERVAQRVIGARKVEWCVGYRLLLAVK